MRKSIVVLVSAGVLATFMGSEKQYAVAKDGVATSNAAVPAVLVGQWQSGSLAAANFYNSSTRQWNEPNGRGMFLIVQANGEYRFGVGEQITTTDYFLYQEGTISMHGSQMVLSPKIGSEYTHDVCTHEDDQHASTQDELRPSTLKFQIVADQADARGAKLVLTNEQGELITLRPNAQ
ncbi:MAG: hypothetical protein ACRENG_26140 [bacterium]